MSWRTALFACCLVASAAGRAAAADDETFTRNEDVIYGRKDGMALTMDVFAPRKNTNGAAVIFVVSGGWFSAQEMIAPNFPAVLKPLLDRGYTAFAVMHGSQPKYTIPDVLQDMHRAVRYIRYHAEDYGIDPERIAITGGSAGGHLSLMQGTAGTSGDPDAKDPIERTSSRVQAVACFVPPTDFLNYGEAGVTVLESEILKNFRPPFAFREFDQQSKVYVPITGASRVREILAQISPIEHISADDAPTLIVHGEKDELVPVEQAERFTARLREAGVPAKLVVKKGAGHGWPDRDKDVVTFADWFDEHLARKASR